MIIWYLIMQPNIIDDTMPYLSYFYNFYATHFAMSRSSNGKKKNKEQVHPYMKPT
jgi:hypothetical protein